jgi:hypothetical protein
MGFLERPPGGLTGRTTVGADAVLFDRDDPSGFESPPPSPRLGARAHDTCMGFSLRFMEAIAMSAAAGSVYSTKA